MSCLIEYDFEGRRLETGEVLDDVRFDADGRVSSYTAPTHKGWLLELIRRDDANGDAA